MAGNASGSARSVGSKESFAKRIAIRLCYHCRLGTPRHFDGRRFKHHENGCAAHHVWRVLMEDDERKEFWS